MTEQDRETHAAIEALAHRIRVRDAAILAGEDCADAEPFSAEFMAALRGRGWRLTEAKVFPVSKPALAAEGTGPSEATRAELDAARQRMDAINEAKRTAREADVA